MKKKRIAGDFLLNLLASIITTGVAQLVLYPLLGRVYSAEEYGVILTVMGIGNTVVSTIGGSLNNVRLMVNLQYEEEGVKGDFLLLLGLLALLSAAAFTIYLFVMGTLSELVVLCLILFAVIGSCRSYGVVAFRIVINYKHNLLCSCMVALGNLAGIVILNIFRVYEMWVVPFLLGELLGVALIAKTSDIFSEPFHTTPYLWSTVKKEGILLITTLFASMLTYLDRLLLLPILGGEAVSYYTVASFFGKSLGVLMTPMAGVLLSYYAQKGFVMTRQLFWKTNLLTLGLAMCFMMGSVMFGRWGTELFYPELIKGATPYLVLANAAAIVGIVGNMTQPAVLRFAPTYWQLVIQLVYCVTYLVGGICGAKIAGLVGFAYASLAAAVIRIVLLYIAADIELLRREDVDER